jgi:uncharacterized membrane protein
MRPIPAWISPVILGSSAAVLGLRWSSIPERFVVHWDASGRPNGWADRSTGGVLLPIGLGLGLWLIFELIGAAVRAGAKPNRAPIATATVDTMRLVMAAIAIVLGVLAISLPLGPAFAPQTIVLGSLGLVTVATVWGCFRFARAIREVREANPADKELQGYKGIYYSNPNDSRLWVPKVVGIGKTINFAHPWAWPVMILITGAPIVFVIATLVLTTCH